MFYKSPDFQFHSTSIGTPDPCEHVQAALPSAIQHFFPRFAQLWKRQQQSNIRKV
jgi:hypothetical protein